jgi:hypothetical protein
METNFESHGSNGGMEQGQATRVSAPFSGVLDDLLALDVPALEALYKSARVPRVGDVQGPLRGRMLAVLGMPAALAGPVRAFAGSSVFPWRGKSFTPRDADHGDGANRLVSDRFEAFRFATYVAPSRGGAFDAMQIDYDNPGNPFFIRAIKDEIRELRPGLWLGQAYAEIGGKPHLALYFGLTSDR